MSENVKKHIATGRYLVYHLTEDVKGQNEPKISKMKGETRIQRLIMKLFDIVRPYSKSTPRAAMFKFVTSPVISSVPSLVAALFFTAREVLNYPYRGDKSTANL